jgi:hypothetical protein
MKPFLWDPPKNDWLKKIRRVSFEQVVAAIKAGQILDNVEHPNKLKYGDQHLFIIRIESYAYLVRYLRGIRNA